MSSTFSTLSTPKVGTKQNGNLEISNKTIDKKKKLRLKQHSNFMCLKRVSQAKQHIEVVPLIPQQKGCSIMTLGNLFFDDFTFRNRIIERKQKNEFVNYILGKHNFNSWKNEYGEYSCDLISYLYYSTPQQQVTSQERKQFEQTITDPFECFLFTKYFEDILTISKKLNLDYIRMLGVNFEMLDDYVSKNGFLPKCWDNQNNIFEKLSSKNSIQITNYQGEKFVAQISFKKLLEHNQYNDITNTYIYVIYSCERKWLNVQKIEENFMNYFKLTELPSEQFEKIHQSKLRKPCGLRSIQSK